MLSNLPVLLTSFVGRQMETTEILRLLSDYRLLTLTGPGGCGKTRLALEAGRAVSREYPDGVWLVDYTQVASPVVDDAIIARTMANALGIIQQKDQEIAATLLSFLQNRRLLVILDNCEHVAEEVARLVNTILVGTNPTLKILATSQVALGLPGEVEWLVPSLPFPEPGCELQSIEELLGYAAVKLFVSRAAAVQTGFQVTQQNAGAVIDICQKLDGIPLAIELAAARVKFLGVAEIASRLGDRFTLLSTPRAMVAPRHQTLKAAVDWSYSLLSSNEQSVLCYLSIFSGAWTLEAAEAVCNKGLIAKEEIIVLIGQLVDHSLVLVVPAEGQVVRYRLLETIRLYGQARLSTDEWTDLHDRHLDWYARFAQEADQNIHGPDQAAWFNRLQEDLPNLHSALQWSVIPESSRRLVTGLKLAVALSWFWRVRGYAIFGSGVLERLLALSGDVSEHEWVAARAGAHYGLGWLYYVQAKNACLPHTKTSRSLWQSLGTAGKRGYALATSHLARLYVEIDFVHDPSFAGQLIQESLEQFQEIGDPWGEALATYHAAEFAEVHLKDFPKAEEQYRQALAAFQKLGDELYIGLLDSSLGNFLLLLHRLPEAYVYQMEAFRHWNFIGFLLGTAITLENAGDVKLEMGDLDQAEALYNQARPYIEKTGLKWNMAIIEACLGEIHLRQRKSQDAEANFRQAVEFEQYTGDLTKISNYLYGLAAAIALDHPARAARITGYAEVLLSAENQPASKISEEITRRLNAARNQMGEPAFKKARAEGQFFSVEKILTPESTSGPTTQVGIRPQTPLKAEKARFSGLTAREREIAVLISHGLSNLEIARDMSISERTVTTHITNILSKLGFSSRTQVAAWAVEKGLAGSASS